MKDLLPQITPKSGRREASQIAHCHRSPRAQKRNKQHQPAISPDGAHLYLMQIHPQRFIFLFDRRDGRLFKRVLRQNGQEFFVNRFNQRRARLSVHVGNRFPHPRRIGLRHEISVFRRKQRAHIQPAFAAQDTVYQKGPVKKGVQRLLLLLVDPLGHQDRLIRSVYSKPI